MRDPQLRDARAGRELFGVDDERKARRGETRSTALSMRARMAGRNARARAIDSRSGNLTTAALTAPCALSLLPWRRNCGDDHERGRTSGVGIAMGLAARIRRARRIAGLSQQALADALGVTRSAVSNWESDSGVRPATDRLAVLAQKLHVGFEWIATGRGEMRVCAEPRDRVDVERGAVVDCPHELQLLQAYRRAPARVKALLQEMANLHAPTSSRRKLARPARELRSA
jgi:transcriptional regulator with XRE-family HTH domain